MTSTGAKDLTNWEAEKKLELLPKENGLGFPNPNDDTLLDRFRKVTPRNLACAALDALMPDLLRRRSGARRAISSTAWLDGLRGWAALVVCMVHLTVYTHQDIELCYNHPLLGISKFNNTPAALPIIRIFFTGGHFAVMVFFVISGYVITKKPISLLHEGRREDFIEAINSAMIRRPLRLFLPVVGSTLFFACAWHIFGIATPWPEHQSNIFTELVRWLKETSAFFYFFRTGLLFTWYNPHTWTIPVELRGSMFLFTWLFSLHQIPNRIRILMTVGMVLHLAIGSSGAWYACFFAGMLTAELDLLAHESSGGGVGGVGGTAHIKLPWDAPLKALKRRRVLYGFLMHGMLLCGLLLASEPSSDYMKKAELYGSCPGWRTLQHLIPRAYGDGDSQNRWFWLFWAAWMVLVAVKEIGWLRQFFEARFSLYLGKISFALYLLHGPLIAIYSERLFYLTGVKTPQIPEQVARIGYLHNKWHDASWWPLPDGGSPGLEPNFLFCVVLSIPVFLYAAELGTKMFDIPSLHLSRRAWLYLKGLR